MGLFDDTIRMLDQIGVADVFLPFFLIFVIVFAVLQKTKVLGDKKQFDVVVAIVMGLAVVFPHILNPNGKFDVVPTINNALPQISIVLVAVIMFLLLLGVLGAKFVAKGPLSWVILIGAIVGVVYIFMGASGRFYRLPYWVNNPQTIAIVVTLLIFGIVVWFITKPDPKPEDKDKGFLKDLRDHLKDADEK